MNRATEYAISSTGLYGTAPPNSVNLRLNLQISNIVLLVFKVNKIVLSHYIICIYLKKMMI